MGLVQIGLLRLCIGMDFRLSFGLEVICRHMSYCQKLCMGWSGGGLILAFSVHEFDAANNLGEVIFSI